MTGSRIDAPRVLAIADGAQSYVAAWRVHAPLAALKRSGRVADYVVTDATLAGLPLEGAFDVVWLQRAVDGHVVRRLLELRPNGFLLDIDDHLLCRPEYLRPEEFPSPRPVVEALRCARVLTVTSGRLGGLLARRSGLKLTDKLVVCPNGAHFLPVERREPQRPEAIVLTQGHRLALTSSAPEVLAAIGEFAARHALPICYFGPPLECLSPLARQTLRGIVPAGQAPLVEYHRLLASLPAMLAVAPLETQGAPATVEFVAGKSDVKMLEYGGYGHPAVFSDAPPYTDTDITCGATAENTYEAWSAALLRVWEDGWRTAPAERDGVRTRRDIAVLANDAWARALDRAVLDQPLLCRKLAPRAVRLAARRRDLSSRVAWRLNNRTRGRC